MPVLDNDKHEEFAQLLAKGYKQQDAYTRAGYMPSRTASSRLAASVAVKERVEEIQNETRKAVEAVVELNTYEDWNGLKSLGLSYEWVANQYKKIYTEAMAQANLPAANAAVANIQKMLDAEKEGKLTEREEEKDEGKVSIKDMLALLKGVGELKAPPIMETPKPKSLEMIDITPEEEE